MLVQNKTLGKSKRKERFRQGNVDAWKWHPIKTSEEGEIKEKGFNGILTDYLTLLHFW